MCGICASLGENSVENVVEGLKKLEYRGYDSNGVAYIEGNAQLKVVKSIGEITNLQKKLPKSSSKITIGHTRWATHGAVTEENAHPHVSEDGNFAIVHNGIVENYETLKKEFLSDVNFYSETDTEVFVNLIAAGQGAPLERLEKACELVQGSFAVAMICKDDENIYVAKRHSPLMVASENGYCMAASDLSVFDGKFQECYILDDDEFAVLNEKTLKIFDKNGKKIDKKPISLKNYDFKEDLLDEEFFMLKEIKEQPVVLRRTYFKYFAEKILSESDLEKLRKFKNFCFVACGTAYHAALLGANFMQEFCGKHSEVHYASEFRYQKNTFSKSTLYVFVSQSGETADTLACASLCFEKGLKTLCVTNVPYSSLNKFADFVLPTFAGREVAVASTKAYTAQIFTLLIFSLLIGERRKEVEILRDFVLNTKIPNFDEKIAKKVLNFEKIFFIGRGKDYVAALEGSLKLKEIAYLNCLGLPAGELKHGTLALVDEKTLVIAISTSERLFQKIESNILEVQSRGGHVMLITDLPHNLKVDLLIELPKYSEFLMPIVSIFPLQLLAFYCTRALGYNPDKPRNLAKSVTVE